MVLRKSIGASLVENLIIIGLVSVASIAILTTFGGTIHNVIANSHVKVKTFDPFGAAKPQIAYGQISDIKPISDDVFEVVTDSGSVKINKTVLLNLGEIAFETVGANGALPETPVLPVDTESERALTINYNGRSVTMPKKIVDKVVKIFNSQTLIQNSPLIKAVTVAVEDGSLTITDDMASQIEEAIDQQSESETKPEEENIENWFDQGPIYIDDPRIIRVDLPEYNEGVTELPYVTPVPEPIIDIELPIVIDGSIITNTTGITIGDKFYPISPNIMNRLNTIFPSIGADDL